MAHSGREQHIFACCWSVLPHGMAPAQPLFTLHPCCLCRLWVAYSDGDTEEMPLAELMPLLQPAGPGDKKPGSQLEAEYQRSKAGSPEEVRPVQLRCCMGLHDTWRSKDGSLGSEGRCS